MEACHMECWHQDLIISVRKTEIQGVSFNLDIMELLELSDLVSGPGIELLLMLHCLGQWHPPLEVQVEWFYHAWGVICLGKLCFGFF